MFKLIITCLLMLLLCNNSSAQNFTGVAKYKLAVAGSLDTNTDSMCVIFDTDRIAVILYIPDGKRTSKTIFIDDLKENKSYRLNPDKQTYEVDTLKTNVAYKFVNSNSVGVAVNNELCFRYKAELSDSDKIKTLSAECLGGINYMSSLINNYFFLGVQPIIVDNRIVMDFVIANADGTKPTITVTDIRRMDSVDKYFDLWGYKELK